LPLTKRWDGGSLAKERFRHEENFDFAWDNTSKPLLKLGELKRYENCIIVHRDHPKRASEPHKDVNLYFLEGRIMRKTLTQLWADDRAFIISVELLFIAVILVIGIIAGWAALRSGVATELSSVGASVMNLDPGYNNVSVGSTTASADGTLTTHVNTGLNIGAANAVATNTTVGTDVLGQSLPFPLPITP
jgi:hypothetical protein